MTNSMVPDSLYSCGESSWNIRQQIIGNQLASTVSLQVCVVFKIAKACSTETHSPAEQPM